MSWCCLRYREESSCAETDAARRIGRIPCNSNNDTHVAGVLRLRLSFALDARRTILAQDDKANQSVPRAWAPRCARRTAEAAVPTWAFPIPTVPRRLSCHTPPPTRIPARRGLRPFARWLRPVGRGRGLHSSRSRR